MLKKPFFVFHTKFKPFLSIIATACELKRDIRDRVCEQGDIEGRIINRKNFFCSLYTRECMVFDTIIFRRFLDHFKLIRFLVTFSCMHQNLFTKLIMHYSTHEIVFIRQNHILFNSNVHIFMTYFTICKIINH